MVTLLLKLLIALLPVGAIIGGSIVVIVKAAKRAATKKELARKNNTTDKSNTPIKTNEETVSKASENKRENTDALGRNLGDGVNSKKSSNETSLEK